MPPLFLARSPKQNRGQTLIGVLVTATIKVVVMMGFMSMFKMQNKATRSIAAHGGITDLSHGLDALFGSPGCANVGAANFSQSNGTSPVYVTVGGACTASSGYCLELDKINFSNGSVAVTSLPNTAISALIQPYSITDLTLTGLGGNGASGAGFKFPFKMDVNFTNTSGPSPLPISKFVTFYTDATYKVLGACYLFASLRTESGSDNANCVGGTGVNSGICTAGAYKDITFANAFNSVPQVVVTARKICNVTLTPCTGSATDLVSVYPTNITKTGFRMYCQGSPTTPDCGGLPDSSSFCRGTCDWIAIGD